MYPSTVTLGLGTLCAAISLLTAPCAQDLVAGYSGTLTDLPAGAGQALVLADRDAVVYFTGTRLVLEDSAGARSLLTFADPVFGAFTIRAGEDRLLFGDSSSGDLWSVPLAPPADPHVLARTTFPYDATLFSADLAIVSAKTGGFGSPNNELQALDLVTGELHSVALLPGASGPVTTDASGLYYATGSDLFPAPPGASDVLFFPCSTVRRAIGRRTLGVGDAHRLASGFDSAADLAVDSDGDLFVVDFVNSAVIEWDRQTGSRHTLASYGPSAPPAGALQFVADDGIPRAAFEPFQPRGRRALVIHESFFGGASRLRAVRPARASLATSPGGLTASGLPQNGTALVRIGPTGCARERAFHLPQAAQPLFLLPSLRGAAGVSVILPIAADGTLSVPLPPELPAPHRLSAQIVFIDRSAAVLGSTPPLALH